MVRIIRRKYETPDIVIIQSTMASGLLAGSVVTVTEVPIIIYEEDVTLEDYQNGKGPFDSEFEDLNF